MKFTSTLAVCAAYAVRAAKPMRLEDPGESLVSDVADAIYEEDGYSLVGDLNDDNYLTRREYAASGLREKLGLSFDELNVYRSWYHPYDVIDDYEIIVAEQEHFIEAAVVAAIE